MRLQSVRWATIAQGFLTFAFVVAIAHVASDVQICNYEKFELYDSMYQKIKDDFCVFKDVFMSSDVRYGDFMASSLDYQKIAFVNSKFPIVPPSLYRNFDDIRELYARRCSLDSLRITRLIEKMYAGNNQITSVIVDGNGSNNLKELYLETNMIKDVSNITNLPNLQVLVLENNPYIGNLDLAIFSRMTKMWKLDLENTGMTRVINSLRLNLLALKRLDLSNNQLTYVDMQLLQTFPKLEHLWLNGNKIFYMEIEPIRTFLPDIRSIVIDDNYWGCQHLSIVSKYFLDNNIIIRSGECKTRSVHKVCCDDTTDLIDYRYIIEMSIKNEAKFHQEVKNLDQENHKLQETVDGMRNQLSSLIQNYTGMIQEMKNVATQPPPTLSPSSESAEDYSYYESSEPEHDQDSDPDADNSESIVEEEGYTIPDDDISAGRSLPIKNTV
ncbi:leucine-rich repeat transmembrane neuronal protein 3-like [Ochlerotatus camptorhynchus]|uniref:leucine-rich repeat transmembrane neuronal protein 3-like n=1 Tax=Ochlerotatus camptorhynchus TaxID=644619 RepID=UPI0031E0B7E6